MTTMKTLDRVSQYFGLTTGSTSVDSAGQTRSFSRGDPRAMRARYMAERITSGFQLHDRRQRDEALEAFHEVDRMQFSHLGEGAALEASEMYVEALWRKDEVEKGYQVDGVISAEAIEKADYGPVLRPLKRRAQVVGMDELYAEKTAEAWHRHKTNGDYWTSFLEAQTAELRAALDDPDYPDKPKEGQSGYGPLPTRYILAVELHDQHTPEAWEEAINVMAPYYEAILEAHGETGR